MTCFDGKSVIVSMTVMKQVLNFIARKSQCERYMTLQNITLRVFKVTTELECTFT